MNFVLSRRGFVLAGASLTLAGCATTPVLLAGEALPELEPLVATPAGRDALTIRVMSKGCASKADFVFRTDRKDGHVVLAFARRRLETCKGPPNLAELRFSYDELGVKRGERVVVANPVLYSIIRGSTP